MSLLLSTATALTCLSLAATATALTWVAVRLARPLAMKEMS